MSRQTLFGMELPVGPQCCGRNTILFRQEPLPDDESRTRQQFRCGFCGDVLEVLVPDRPHRTSPLPGRAPFCCRCGHAL